MEVHNIRFLQEALDDLTEIILYIAQNNYQATVHMEDIIIAKINDLAQYPKRGRLVPDIKMSEAGYRMLGIKPYIVFYRIIDMNVFIYRILHGAMNYPLLYEQMVKSIKD